MAGVDKEPDYLPVYPKYALLLKREATFDDRWPDSLKGLIPDLAKAGFYYRGVSDKTICFHCGMTLNLWEPTDDPYVEHAYWNPNCPYINTYEGREWVMNVFINHLLRAGYKPSPEIKPLLDQTSTEIQATGKYRVSFIRNIPEDDEKLVANLTIPHLLIFDDMMGGKAIESIVDWFTRKAHHRNTSVIYITQNLFDRAPQHRTISLNAHYLVLFKNPRDKSQISVLSRQLALPHLMSAYQEATSVPHGYLLVDLNPQTPDEYRLRSRLFEWLTVHMPQEYK
ncbi:putative inhibitor of apoptosis [Saccostrea echinata]|uniref:putative inhibitor of apoptosis n=1 Tax=Saccostrea echinata TaxID=191078 RepID=UPI002A8114E0|nr:putative inhibitor of apoptosis [Saccostrea echinata]XP_061193214.1 putative inhibitor of apoptosis [Saccostrea echinata]